MSTIETFRYDNRIVKYFAIATIVFGVVAFLVGILAAVELFWPEANLNLSFTTFGRIRPLHTNAAIFAFVGNAIFCGVYYSLQRLCKARMFSDLLSWINFWGWQAIIVAAAITLPLGMTTSKEYAELEWPIDLAITFVWVVFTINMLGTIARRRERHMYVAIWFYIATAITVAVLHIFNSLETAVTMFKSYPVYAGVQDALVQWWYGHNAVAFFLTTPYLGLMYYFLPKAANRPVFSYRLSIIHFWALIFIYIWAGPHHLMFTALPDWAQSLGMVFSLMLIAPSWGGMLNGLLTLRGAWNKVREDPVLKFLVVAVTAYGMSTLEGPMLSIKSVNALSHFTDWTIAHVHTGTLGWNGFLTFGMLYWLMPRLWNTNLWSIRLANYHFWIGLLGMVFYVIPLYWAGVTQGLMWKQFDAQGFLTYPNFLETVINLLPMYRLRAIGGILYLIGFALMVVNLVLTCRRGVFIPETEAHAAPLEREAPVEEHHHPWRHRWLERKPLLFTVLTTIAILIGGIVEAVPTFMIQTNVPTISSVKPYTALELLGRDIYIREGCVGCHTQMIRPFRSETQRYAAHHPDGTELYSKAGEYVYDHPFLWGSKRTGPDLHRIGGKYSDDWHYRHMENPRAVYSESVMPAYPWLITDELDLSSLPARIKALRGVGVPYPSGYEQIAFDEVEEQAQDIATRLQGMGLEARPDREIIALIAYLQRLGTDITREPRSADEPDAGEGGPAHATSPRPPAGDA